LNKKWTAVPSKDLQGVSLKNTHFIFGYNSHNNGPINIKFAANVR